MEGGRNLAAPPLQLWRVGARKQLTELLSSSSLYSMGAGGFATVPAFPTLIRLRQPANPNSTTEQRLQQLYVTAPLPTKQQIRRQFGVL